MRAVLFILKLGLKILAVPVVLALTLFTWLCFWLLYVSSFIFGLVSTVVALLGTAHKRGTERHLAEAAEVFDEVENSPVMQDLWAAYQKKFSYASDLGWDTVMAAVRQLFARCEGTV